MTGTAPDVGDVDTPAIEPLSPDRRRTGLWFVAAVAVVAVLALVTVPDQIRFALYPQDEGLLLAYPSLLLKGWVPNRGFESVYGTVNLWVLAGSFKLLGASVAVERMVGLAYRLVVIGSLMTLAVRRRGPGAALCAGVTSIVIMAGTIGLAAFGWIAGVAFVGLGLALADVGLATGRRRWTVASAGLCFGLALGCRLDLVVAVGLLLAVIVLLRPTSRVPLAAGLLVGLVPLALNLVQAGPAAVLRQQVLTPIFVTGPSRRLPLGTLGWQSVILLVLCGGIGVALLVFGAREVRRDRSQWNGILMMATGLLDLGLIPEAVQRSDMAHLALVACWVVPSAVLLPPLIWANRKRRETPVTVFNALPPAVALVGLLLIGSSSGRIYWSSLPVVGTPASEFVVAHGDRSVPVPSAESRAELEQLLAAVDAHSRNGQRLFVGPMDLSTAGYADTYLYYLLPELPPATRYLEMDPGVSNGAGSTLASELRSADLLILNSAYDNFPDADPSTRHGSQAPNQVVNSYFEPVASAGTWTLYDRRTP